MYSRTELLGLRDSGVLLPPDLLHEVPGELRQHNGPGLRRGRKARKRGRRGGLRQRIRRAAKLPLPPMLLCNPRSLKNKLDDLRQQVGACYEYQEQARHRFQLELEFVQCLANPNYLNFLAQRGYLREKPFVNYLKYLLYWKEPEYAKFLKYPHCLLMLELLQYEHFRKELVNAQCAKFIDEQQILHWQHYSQKRTRLQQALCSSSNRLHPMTSK
ncbi:mediator of RNA polymerase II transcription subunit 31-like [Carassius carassius]|uniref:mediator of RNA polymerase II transcription subunit 31-like n=1 Tax=Carassius carassius TaxID=217509 RepID=UPI0028689D16|nr:mediator of RNA polymerase II transcription subunit 31-like [Carassius carassius]